MWLVGPLLVRSVWVKLGGGTGDLLDWLLFRLSHDDGQAPGSRWAAITTYCCVPTS